MLRSTLKALVVGSVIFGGSASSAIPDNLSDDAQRFGAMWELTEERCALAVKDPVAYARSLQSRDPVQSNEVSNTEDGTHVVVRHIVNGVAEEFWFSDVGPLRRVECNHFIHDVDFSAAPNPQNERWGAAIREYMATRPELSLSGWAIARENGIFNSMQGDVVFFHYNVSPDVIAGTRSQALSVDMMPSSFIAVQIVRGVGPTVGDIFSAGPLPASSATVAVASGGATDAFTRAVKICLDHMVDKSPVETFRDSGFVVTPLDEGTFGISGPGMSGSLAPLLPTEWCWLESEELNQQDVAELTFRLAKERFPDGIEGPAERGELANGCPSLSLAYSSTRLSLLEFRNAGFFFGCEDGALGGVLFR